MAAEDSKFRLKVIVAFTLVYILWGSTYIGIAIAVEHVAPLMMGAARFIVAGALMLGWQTLRGTRVLIPLRELIRLTIIGFLLLVSGNIILAWAETILPSGLAALIIAITPLWFLLLEHFSSRGDRIAPKGIAGIVLGLGGVVVLLWPDLSGSSTVGKRELFAASILLLGSMSWALGSILSKRWHTSADPYTASGWEMLNAGLINLLLALSFGQHHHTVWARSSVLAIGYLVIAGSLVGFTAYIWLLRNVPTPKVATYAYVNPIVAVFLGWLIKDEKITPFIIGGAVIVVISVILVTGAKAHQAKVAEEETVPELPACESTGD